jgi:hypothetical protein
MRAAGDGLVMPGYCSHGTKSSKVVRRPFTVEEDALLIELLSRGDLKEGWQYVASQVKGRSARQCRERWCGYLAPGIRMEPWTEAEDRLLVARISQFGHQWTRIAKDFNGRSGNDTKNRWYSHLKEMTCRMPDGSLQLMNGADPFMSSMKRKRKRKIPARQVLERVKGDVKRSPSGPVASECVDLLAIDFVSGLPWRDLPPLIQRQQCTH